MADNTQLSAAVGSGDTIATDDISGVKYQRIKLIHGADGVNAGDVSTANPLPVGDAGGTLTVDAPVGTPVFVRLSDGSAAITTLPVSLASVPSHAVTNAGTFAVQVDAAIPAGTNNIGDVDVLSVVPGTGVTNLGKAEDAAHSSGDVGVFMLGVRRDSATSGADTDGDYAALGLDSSGRLHTNVGNTVTVTGTVTAAQATAANLNCTEASAAAIKTAVEVMDDWDNAASDGASVSGDVAHDTADAGEPVKVGAKATTALSALTLVADADRTNLFAGVDGVQIIRQDCNLEDIVTATPVAITDGSSTSVISAQGSGVKFYLTEITIANSSSSNVTVDLRDGTAGSVKWTFPVPANGGVVKTFKVPLPFSANTAMAADPSAAASTITVSALGFKSKV